MNSQATTTCWLTLRVVTPAEGLAELADRVVHIKDGRLSADGAAAGNVAATARV